MSTPRRYQRIVGVLFPLCLLAAGAAWAQEPQVELQPFILSWLQDTCDTGESTTPEQILTRFGADAEPLLLAALEQGPGDQLLQTLESALETRWQQRSAALAEGERLGLSSDDLAAARQAQREEYFSRERQAFVTRYRDRAVQGLALVGSRNAVQALQQLADDPQSPLNASARDALEAVRQRLSPRR